MTALGGSNAFARFARAHLPTDAERAIDPVLAGASYRS